MAEALHGSVALQVQDKVMNALLDSGFIVAAELNEVEWSATRLGLYQT